MLQDQLDAVTRAALVAAGLLFFLAGTGWALVGGEVFLATVAAGLAGCF